MQRSHKVNFGSLHKRSLKKPLPRTASASYRRNTQWRPTNKPQRFSLKCLVQLMARSHSIALLGIRELPKTINIVLKVPFQDKRMTEACWLCRAQMCDHSNLLFPPWFGVRSQFFKLGMHWSMLALQHHRCLVYSR